MSSFATASTGDDFPDVSFDDPRVKLADLTGDGLQDIVRVHNGSVEYWPYRGYGRWGRRVTMGNAPRFEDAAFFPGSGFDPTPAAGRRCGRRWRSRSRLRRVGPRHASGSTGTATPGATRSSFTARRRSPTQTAVRLVDMLGTGTEGILWTYDFGAFRRQHLQVPRSDGRDQTVPARSDGQPDGRGDQDHLRAIDAVLPGR